MIANVSGRTCAEAWARGVLAIRDNRAPLSPLITEISEPCIVDKSWWRDLSPRRISTGANTLHSVVEMVGPDELIKSELSRAATYDRAWKKFDRCRSMGRHLSNWRDTYFERFTRQSDGTNRLEIIISKMNSWTGRRVASFYAHTTSNSLDGVVPIGNPCLQYIQFVQRDNNILDLFAVYRNHDFFLKALGNYVGLGRVLAFVARETTQVPGSLTCFSINAYLDKQRQVCPLAQSVLR